MTAQITTLIDKQDNVEVIRDQIALILLEESCKQEELAALASKPNPLDWRLRVFTSRANPWEEFQSAPDLGTADAVPIVNVSLDSETFDMGRSDIVERQYNTAVFNIDCFGYGVSCDTPDGHDPGDAISEMEALRARRMVRNILMSAHHIYLQFRGTVSRRWMRDVQVFQPVIDNIPVSRVMAARLSFQVEFSEFSPQVVGGILNEININLKRKETGEVYLDATFNP